MDVDFGITISLGLLSLAITLFIFRRTGRMIPKEGLEELSYFPWDILIFPEMAFLALAMAFSILLLGLLLFVLWLPLTFLALNLLSIGELWRTYRAVFVEVEEGLRPKLGPLGKELLGLGATLPKSWDGPLEGKEASYAGKLRRAHVRIHEALLFFAGSSLLLTALVVASRVIPAVGWNEVVLVAGAVALVALIALLWTLSRRSRLRSSYVGF